MVNGKKITRRAALGLATAGGLVLVRETFGFSQVIGDRSVSVSVADDEDALIALVEADYAEIPTNGFETVAYLTNNVGDDVDLEYTVSTNQNGVSIRFDGQEGGPGDSLTGTTTIPEGDAEPIELECSNPGQIGDDEVLTVELPVVRGRSGDVTIEGVRMDQEFYCDGAVLEILDVRGLSHATPSHEFAAEVDVAETDGETTENLTVALTVVGDSSGQVYEATRAAPGDFPEIRDETVTVRFDDVGQLPEDDYEYTVTADADNANTTVESGSFVVTDEGLPPDLVVESVAVPNNSKGTIEFDVRNRGDRDAVLTALSVDEATHDTQTVDHVQQDGNEFERSDGPGALDARLEVPGDRTSLDETATVGPDELATFRLGTFRGPNGNQINMNDGSADVTLYLDGEPEQQLSLNP